LVNGSLFEGKGIDAYTGRISIGNEGGIALGLCKNGVKECGYE